MAVALAGSGLIIGVTACAAPSQTTSAQADTPVSSVGTGVSAIPSSHTAVVGSARARTGSLTAEDWATYADHIAVVTVVSERQIGELSEETGRNTGGMIGRTVNLNVEKILWSAPDAPRGAPESFEMEVAGWFLNDNTDTSRGTHPFAMENSPRISPGHTYIKAIEWIDDPCSQDEADGTWDALGPGDTIPYDRGVVGAGEFEGKDQTVEEAKSRRLADSPNPPSLRDLSAGRSVDQLVASVEAASPRKETGYLSVPRECDRSG